MRSIFNVFKNSYAMEPWKFTNVTNGIDHRRWLSEINPGLDGLVRDLAGGDDYLLHPQALKKLDAYADDATVLKRLDEIKWQNKVKFADYARKAQGVTLDPNAIFDVQVKRLHEYKRQLLNVLHIITLYQQLQDDPNCITRPHTFLFGAKAAPGYAVAKRIIHLINSGATTLDGSGQSLDAEGNPVMKEPWNLTDADVENCLKATTWYPADRDYFRGGGFSSNFLSKGGMPVTMMRLNLIKGLGPVLQIAEGWTVEIDPEIHQKLNMRTDPTWPTTWFVPRLCDKSAFKDVYSVMNNWGANHGAISYGHIGQDLITLASMLRIPVCMHNVDENEIFRPAAWNAFGMDKEGADYRACTTYGPIYK